MEKGKFNEYAGLYGSMFVISIALLLVESRNAIGGLNCPANLVAKPSFLSFVELATLLFLTFQNLKKFI